MTDNFSRQLLVSCVGHLAIFLLVFFSAVLVPQERVDIRNAIRVDVVGLPKKMETLPEAPPAPAPPQAEVKVAEPPPKTLPQKIETAPVKTPAPVVPTKLKKNNIAKSEKHALDKLKALEALDKIKQEVGKEKAASRAKSETIAGNKAAPGNALSGLDKIEYDRYFDELSSKIHSLWNIPQWLADADLKAQVLVLIDDRGFIVKKVFKKSSGNEVFDAKVIEAIDGSQPLPPPPQKLRGMLATSGIVFNFPQ